MSSQNVVLQPEDPHGQRVARGQQGWTRDQSKAADWERETHQPTMSTRYLWELKEIA